MDVVGLRETAALRRVAMFSVHSCPLAALGGQETGGMNVYVRELSRLLGQHGIAVDVFTRRQDPCMPMVTEFGPQARVIHLNAGPAAPYAKHRVLDHLPEFLRRVQSFIATHDLSYDLLHSHYWLSGWVGLRLRQTLVIPLVHMSHTLAHPKNSAVQQAWEREPSTRLEVEYEVLQQSDQLVAESEASKCHMRRDYNVNPEMIDVIPCGVDTSIFYPRDRDQARQALGLPHVPLLLFVGRLQPLKGIDTLLRSVALVRRVQPELQVLIVGGEIDTVDAHEQQECQRLQALTTELELTQNTHFIPAQPQEILAQYYAAADIVVMPSHYESFGMVVLEAMACGTAVVASRVGGLASTVLHGQTGFLATVGDAEEFASAIQTLLETPAVCSAMGQAGYARAQTFAWPRIVDRTQRLYRHVLRRYAATIDRGAVVPTMRPMPVLGERLQTRTVIPVLSEPSV